MDELVEFQELKKDLAGGRGPVLLSGCIDSQKAHLISELSGLTPWKLVITYDEQKAREICDDCRCFCPETFLYPSRDLLFYSSDIQGNLLTNSLFSCNLIKQEIVSLEGKHEVSLDIVSSADFRKGIDIRVHTVH